MGPLHGLIRGLFLEYFTLLRRVSRALHQACFVTGWPISHMACMIFLALASVALIVVGCQGRFYSLTVTAITGMVGI